MRIVQIGRYNKKLSLRLPAAGAASADVVRETASCCIDRLLRIALVIVLVSGLCVPPPAHAVAAETGGSQPAVADEGPGTEPEDGGGEKPAASTTADAQEEAESGSAHTTDEPGSSADDQASGEGRKGGDPLDSDKAEGSDAGESSDSERGRDADRGVEQDADRDKPVDLAEKWEANQAVVDAGDYALTSDVHASAPLKVALPAGSKATIDLAGFDVEIDGGAACAVDLSRNAGEVLFVDSAYDEKRPGELASIALKVGDPSAPVAAIRVMRPPDTRATEPKVSFEHVRISVDVTVGSIESYGVATATVKTGLGQSDEKWKAEDERVSLLFKDCALSASTEVDDSALAKRAAAEEVRRGGVSVIDAGCRGVSLDGFLDVSVEVDGDAAGSKEPALLSAFEGSYTIGSEFEAADYSGNEEEGAELVFGFPAKLRSDDATGAVVAKAGKGGKISDVVAKHVKAEAGYDVAFDASDAGGVAGFSGIRLVRQESANAALEKGEKAEADEASASSADALVETAVEEDGQPTTMPALGARSRVYASYVASHSEELVYPGQIAAQVAGTDLNAAWKAQVGGLDNAFTISTGGTYYLSADLETKSNLIIDTSGVAVTIRFAGHKLTINGDGAANQKTLVSIVSARSVTFDGADAGSVLESAGDLDVWGISSTAEGCAVSATGLTVNLSAKSNAQRNLGTHCIRIASGSLTLSGCTVNMDMANQALRSSDLLNIQGSEVPSAIYADAGVDSVVLEDCTVSGEGTSAFQLGDVCDVTSIGNAYALYSLAADTKVKGGSYRAVSVRGNATCLYGANLSLCSGESTSGISLEADAGQIASGVLSTSQGGVLVDAPLSFTVGSEYEGMAQAACALRANVQNGFRFGRCVPGDSDVRYGVLVLPEGDVTAANANGFYLGMFEGELDASSRDALVSRVLVDARGQDGSCSVALDLSGIKFVFDGSKAVATVTDTSGNVTAHATINEAITKLSASAGGTLTLCKDVGDVSVASVPDGAINLNGKTMSSLTYTASGSGSGLSVANGTLGGSATVVTHSSRLPLSFDHVAIKASVSDGTAYGINASTSAGKLTLTDSSIEIESSKVSSSTSYFAYGIYAATNGPDIELDHSSVAVRALTASVYLYGVYSMNSIAVKNGSSINVSGQTASLYGLYAGGVVDVSSSLIDAYASGDASTVVALGLRTSNPKASDVTVANSTVTARSLRDDVSDATYACILGASSEAGSVSPSGTLTLKGQNTFQSAGGMHLGMNLGDIELGDGFGLGAGSDQTLVISQSRRTNNVGFSLPSGTTADEAQSYASMFAVKDGSYYDGWKLVPSEDGGSLVWRSAGDADGRGVIALVHGNSQPVPYATVSDALADAQSGDTVKVLADLTESGTWTVGVNDLVVDLGGNELTLRANGDASAGNAETGGAVKYSGTGVFAVQNGTLSIEVGASTESAIYESIYHGISVYGGGQLDIAANAAVNVEYTGSSSPSAAQRTVSTRGIAMMKGSLDFKGQLFVCGAASDGFIGSMETYGVFAQPEAQNEARVNIAEGSRVKVDGRTAVKTTKNTYYAESASTQASPMGLREITVDSETDADFYQDIVDKFRVSATFDDPSDTTLRNVFGANIYFAQNMQLDCAGKWYDGMKIWAFSDEVTGSAVGKKSSIVPAHIFVSSQYDELPQACGVGTSEYMDGSAFVTVKGAVEADCAHGNACALDLSADEAGKTVCACEGAFLSASADSIVHPLAKGVIDLRDYIEFSNSEQKLKVAYSNMGASQVVQYGTAAARDIVVGENASLSLAKSEGFAVSGLDAAAVEADSFTVGPDFSLKPGSALCSVANPAGSNRKGAVFAEGAVNPALFEDAYGVLAAGSVSKGVGWADSAGFTVVFKVGDAVVARFADSVGAIDLSQLSGIASRADDQRQKYELVGWSQSPDEWATSGFVPRDSSLSNPGRDAVYYAVYDTGLTTVPITFTGMHDAAGALMPDVVVEHATYGVTVGKALEDDGGKEIPAVPDYYIDTVTGLEYRFVGWHPYTVSAPTAAQAYDSEQVRDMEITLSVNGVNSTGGLTLYALYRVVRPSQHLIKFVVDGHVAACVVEDGAFPDYLDSDGSNPNYIVPGKSSGEAGKTYTFAGWFVDSNGNGSHDNDESEYAAALPRATEDAVYTADWTWEWSDVKYTFHIKYYHQDTDTFDEDGTKIVNTTYGQETQDAADSAAKIGSKVSYGGKVYTLLGWTVRSSDVDPIYDASKPLPSLGSGDRALTTSYTKTYYGVYAVSDHMVTVSFYDGGSVIGSSTVASLKSVSEAFDATGASEPADQSASKQFLGWSTSSTASSPLDEVSTNIESLAGSQSNSLSLFSVYGVAPVYTIRLRSADGAKILYQVSVRRGRTVNSVFEAAGVELSVPLQIGKYFSGWRTAAGTYFSLDDKVTGSADLYASYKDIVVTSGNSSDITATVTSVSPKVEQASSVSFTIVPRASADSPIRSATSEAGYTILKSYDIRFVATSALGAQTVVTGEFGTAAIKVYVGSRYRNSKVRVFWLGEENGNESVMNSAAKTVDDDGYISLAIDNYLVGDADEGGNLAVAYVEGGTSNATIKGKDSSNSTGKPKGKGPSSSSSSGSSSSGKSDSKADDPGASASRQVPMSASQVGFSASLGSSLGRLSGSSKLSGNKLGSSSGSGVKSGSPSLGTAANGGGFTDGSDDSDGSDEEDAGEGELSPFADWDSNAVSFVALMALVLAGAVCMLWRLLVVRQRRDEAEAELPVMANRYAKGVRF